MTTKQMDELDDRRRLHALLVHDAWAALGLDARILNDYYGRDGVTPEDLWAQIVAAIRGNFVSLEADTNPPAPAELKAVARRRHDEAYSFDRLREMYGLSGSAVEMWEAIERYDRHCDTKIEHLQDEVERLTEELSAASTVEIDRDELGNLTPRYPDGRPDWLKASPEVLDKLCEYHNERLNNLLRLHVWKSEAMEVLARWDEVAAMVPAQLGESKADAVERALRNGEPATSVHDRLDRVERSVWELRAALRERNDG